MRGALFNALEALEADFSRVLDLYAGTGALGIEALSRGAEWCDFVERDRAMAEVIRENLAMTGFAEQAKVYPVAAERAVQQLSGEYTIILADPPYADGAALGLMERVADSGLVAADGAIILEHSAREEPRGDLGGFHLARELRHGDSAVSIYLPLGGERC